MFAFSRRWSGDEDDDEEVRGSHVTTEHPLAEATIPLVSHSHLQETANVTPAVIINTTGSQTHRTHAPNQQESVLQKFRKSFSLRFHKKGSKESTESECPPDCNEGSVNLEDDNDRHLPTVSDQPQHKEESGNDQRFRSVYLISYNRKGIFLFKEKNFFVH